jgi:hypothetical protein
MSRPLLLFSCAAVCALAPAAASAQDVRVAVAPFDGNGASGARRQTQGALSDDGRVSPIELDRVDAEARRFGVGAEGDDGVRELATELGANVVVQGQVQGRGRRRRVRLTARDHEGRRIASASAPMRGGGVARAVRSLLDDALPRASAPPGAAVEEAEPVEVSEDQVPFDPSEDAGQGDGEDAGDDGGASGGWRDRMPLLEVQLGLVPRNRSANVAFLDGTSGRYDAWYVELGARAELRPLAQDTGVARGIFVRTHFSHAVGLTTRTPTGGTVGTAFYRFEVGAGYLFPIELLDLGVALDVMWDVYNLGPNMNLESVEYAQLRPAVRAQVRLFHEAVVLRAELGFRAVVGRGDWGDYGRGDTYGFDIGGGVGGAYSFGGDVGISYGVELGWVGYWPQFTAPPPPMMAVRQATSGTESGVRFGIWAGLSVF